MKLFCLTLLFFYLLNHPVNAQRETRAVWLTTNFNLDWPKKNSSEEEQKEDLRAIFKNLKQNNFNTLYFQVRSNGTVLYNSQIEPFSPYLTGETGVKPNYDPLQFAIDLGKEFNIEVHAWVNMVRCFSGNDDRILKHPKHIINTHRNWTVRVMDSEGGISYWLNPGYFQVQDYLVDLIVELTGKYDVDGIQLDFFRYPGEKFDDEKYFDSYGFNMSLADWRRNNITNILRKIRQRIKPVNPYLKIGATPIGIRKNLNGARGWEGFHSVFQDTETWLEEGLVDYLVPQIYWDMNSNPKFEILAHDWITKSHGKNIVLGLAAYKKDVKPELLQMINTARKLGAAGVAFFRYQHVADLKDNYYSDLALPSNMPWKESNTVIDYSIDVQTSVLSQNEILLKWLDNSKKSNLYRSYALKNDEKIIKLINLNKNKVRLNFGRPSKLMYNYQITKLNRLWNSLVVSRKLKIQVPYLAALKKSSLNSPKTFLQKISDTEAFLVISSNSEQSITLDILNLENLGTQIISNLKIGTNLIKLPENPKIIKSIRITYLDTGEIEELNLI